LSPGGAAFLEHTIMEAEKRGIEVIYVLPWSYCKPELAAQLRETNEILLADISKRVSVLWEPSLGVHDRIEDFSDSVQHLTAEAATLRSRFLSEALMGSKKLENKPEPYSQSPITPTSGKTMPNIPP
jgi:hypothetical protein